MAVSKKEGINPEHYIKVATADTDPAGVVPGSTLWDQQANKVYKTIDGTTWVLLITLG